MAKLFTVDLLFFYILSVFSYWFAPIYWGDVSLGAIIFTIALLFFIINDHRNTADNTLKILFIMLTFVSASSIYGQITLFLSTPKSQATLSIIYDHFIKMQRLHFFSHTITVLFLFFLCNGALKLLKHTSTNHPSPALSKTPPALLASNNQFLGLLSSLYVLITITSDLYESKIIHLYWLHSGSGVLLFSCTFFIIGIITYVYDFKAAKKTILLGLSFCLIFYFLSCLASHHTNLNTQLLLSSTRRIFASTFITSLISEWVNAYIIQKMKTFLGDQYRGIALFLSILISTGISMTIFCLIAFSSRMNLNAFLVFTLSSWLYRFGTEIILFPLSLRVIDKLTQLEKRPFSGSEVKNATSNT